MTDTHRDTVQGQSAHDDASRPLNHRHDDRNGIGASDLFADDALLARFTPVFATIAAGAVERESKRELAHEAVELLREAGFTKLRIPKSAGGDDITLAQYFDLVTRLAEADSNLPQILRAHGAFIEYLRESQDATLKEKWFAELARGKIVGAAVSERTQITNNSVRATETDKGWRLDGEKYYTTGSIYADWMDLTANNGETDIRVLISTTAKGVTIVDDWDGFGQRLTGSGTVKLDGALTAADNVYLRYDAANYRRDSILTSYYQQTHLATLVGIARAGFADALRFTKAKTRTFGVAGQSRPAEDPLVQRVIGRLASLTFSTQSLSSTIAHAIDDVARARAQGKADTSLFVRLETQTFQAQQIILQQTLEVATLLFEVGGASATSESRRLDRHWRNARVLASHNPAIVREATIGRFYLTGEANFERSGLGHIVAPQDANAST